MEDSWEWWSVLYVALFGAYAPRGLIIHYLEVTKILLRVNKTLSIKDAAHYSIIFE